MGSRDERFEIVKGTGAEEAFVELWDRALAPGGLAFEAAATDEGTISITGHRLPVDLATLERFLAEAKAYLAPELEQQERGWAPK